MAWNNKTRLKAEDRDRVVDRLGREITALAREFGISPYTVCGILRAEFKGQQRRG